MKKKARKAARPRKPLAVAAQDDLRLKIDKATEHELQVACRLLDQITIGRCETEVFTQRKLWRESSRNSCLWKLDLGQYKSYVTRSRSESLQQNYAARRQCDGKHCLLLSCLERDNWSHLGVPYVKSQREIAVSGRPSREAATGKIQEYIEDSRRFKTMRKLTVNSYSRPGDDGDSRYSLEDLKINFRELLQPTS